MSRVPLTAEVEPEIQQRVKIAAIREEMSVDAWVARAVTRELQREHDADINDDDEELILPPLGMKPRGLQKRIKLRGGGTMSDAVIEDRR